MYFNHLLKENLSNRTMHTYLLRVGLVGKNNNRILKERMDHKLVDIFESEGNFHLWVDAMWRSSTPEKKSFFVNIMVKDKRHIIITAEFKEIKTLRDLAAMVVARCFNDKRHIIITAEFKE